MPPSLRKMRRRSVRPASKKSPAEIAQAHAEQLERVAEMAALDALPAKVRNAITAARVKIPATECLKLISAGEPVDYIVEAVRMVDDVKSAKYRKAMAAGKFSKPKG
jgi:hypothetical protein